MRLMITKEDRIGAIPRNGWECLVAIAARNQFNVKQTLVATDYLYVKDQRYRLSDDARRLLNTFDKGEGVELPTCVDIYLDMP